jgi:Na+/H+ antiporter NhaD/arsenite permease-like protein
MFSSALFLAATGVFEINPVWIAPFALLLLLIAVMPLAPERVKHAWEHYYPHVSVALGALVAGYYFWQVPQGATSVVHSLHEFLSFIALVGSLFVVAGGIHIRLQGEARPMGNVVFLLIGAVLANFVGTTGASMILIRPWIRMNKYRITAYHIVFFIFIVSNCGGALTPIGDPPLFIGYLRGVPFFWLVEHAMLPWACTIALLLAIFYFIDRRNFQRAPAAVREAETGKGQTLRVDGVGNLLALIAIIVAVFLPARFLTRELVMLAVALASYKLTNRSVHESNHFTFGPIREVAFLFVGIFLTMMPALDYLGAHGRKIPLSEPVHYYLASGTLSAVLDNAPTYANFLRLEETALLREEDQVLPSGERRPEPELVALLLQQRPDFVLAISLGAVFFGAMTYIGNGPNFMVKSIAESSNVKVPSFFGYVFKFSVPFLLPVLLLVGWLFL